MACRSSTDVFPEVLATQSYHFFHLVLSILIWNSRASTCLLSWLKGTSPAVIHLILWSIQLNKDANNIQRSSVYYTLPTDSSNPTPGSCLLSWRCLVFMHISWYHILRYNVFRGLQVNVEEVQRYCCSEEALKKQHKHRMARCTTLHQTHPLYLIGVQKAARWVADNSQNAWEVIYTV